jgi:O-antigen ligase
MHPEDPRPASAAAARRVATFRSRQPRRPLHPAERRLLGVFSVHLCFLPWALGTMHPWSQLVNFGLAAVELALALPTRFYDGRWSGTTGPFRLVPGRKLVRFPIFWLGLALLGYIAVQALNPDWRYVEAGGFWHLARLRAVFWLPTSVAVPFGRSNAWRQGLIYAAAWMTVCAVWIGLTRRRSLRVLLLVLVLNALVLAGLLTLQHFSDGGRVPWPLTAWTPAALTASFIYKNHAGAYFALLTFAAVALALWVSDHGDRMLRKSTPGAVLGLSAVALAGAVAFTLSRGAMLTLALALLVLGAWFFLRRRLRPASSHAHPLIAKTIAALFIVFILAALYYLDLSTVYQRWDAMVTQQSKEESVWMRVSARAAAVDMLEACGGRGVGAGCFRHLFPEYSSRYPAIYQHGQLFWEHAHDDWLEIPIELGLVGDLLLLAGTGWWAVWFVRRKTLWNPLAVPLLLGCGQTLIHAGFDFPFQCPAILTTWCVLLTVAGRWMELEG